MLNEGVSIIIPTFNNAEFLKNCISSIAEYTVGAADIIVVNNGDEKIESHIQGIKVIKSEKNLGWSGGINLALKTLEPNIKYVVLMNDDTEILPHNYDWLYKMTNVMDRDDTVGAVGPCSNVVLGNQNIKFKGISTLSEVKFLIGFCVVIRRELLDKIGGLDESLIGGDDFDWSMAIRKLGFKLIARRDVFVYHYGFVTGTKVHGTYWNSEEMQFGTDRDLIRKHGLKLWTDMRQGIGLTKPYECFKPETIDNHVLLPIAKGNGIDVGCASTKIVSDATGVDLIPKGEKIGKYGGGTLSEPSIADICASCDDMPTIETGSLDYVVGRHVFEHMIDPIKTLREFNRVLKPGGRVGLTLPDGNRVSRGALDETHKHDYSRESLKALFEVTGFEIEQLDATDNQFNFHIIARKIS